MMESGKVVADEKKPHAVCIPSPTQSHIKAMLKLAKLLHCKGGFHITFVNTEFNHQRFLNIRGPHSLDGLPDFKFESIPDGLPPSDAGATQDIPTLSESIQKNFLLPFLNLLDKLNHKAHTSSSSSEDPPVTCIVSDGFMSFSIDAAENLGVPVALFWTISACGFMGFYQLQNLMEKGFVPLKDESYLTNGYLDTIVDWIPGMNNIGLKDLSSFLRTTDPKEPMLRFVIEATERASKASINVYHTFHALEKPLLNALSSMFPQVVAIGPLQLLLNQIPKEEERVVNSIGYNLWKEEPECLQWLNAKKPNSVIYINFGSIEAIPLDQFAEFSWGLANSNQHFLWIIRPDLVEGDSALLPPQFLVETKERGLIANWCSQEQVLNHQAIGGFLTHSGWNSTIESISAGVPMICLPFSGDQQTNCRYTCNEWGIGVEMDGDVKRDKVEDLVREVMVGEKGMRMRNKALEWKKLALEATRQEGSSYLDLDKLVTSLLASRK